MLHGDALRNELGSVAAHDVDQRVAELARTIIDGGADFLFGAGMSAEANIPGGRAVARALLRRLFPDEALVPDADLDGLAALAPLEAVAAAVEAQLAASRDSLAESLTEILGLGSGPVQLPQAHIDFAALTRLGGPTWIRRIFTTNWDDLLETSIGEAAQRVTERNTPDYEAALLSGRIPVVYLHGRLDEEFMLTESDIGDTLRTRSVNLLLLTRLFEARSFCLVGYSMSDPDLSRIYRVYRDQFALRNRHSKLTYVVSPVASASEYTLLDKVWELRDARLIPLTAGEFFARLRAATQTAASVRGVNDLLKGYGWSESELASKTEGLKEVFDLKEDEDAYELLRRLLHQEGGP